MSGQFQIRSWAKFAKFEPCCPREIREQDPRTQVLGSIHFAYRQRSLQLCLGETNPLKVRPLVKQYNTVLDVYKAHSRILRPQDIPYILGETDVMPKRARQSPKRDH